MRVLAMKESAVILYPALLQASLCQKYFYPCISLKQWCTGRSSG